MSTSTDQLSAEVAELLHRTDSLLLRSPSRDHFLAERSRTGRTPIFPRSTSPFSNINRALSKPSSLRSSTDLEGGDVLLDAASRLRSSFETARRKINALQKSSGIRKPDSLDASIKPLETGEQAPTPQLADSLAGRPPTSLTDPGTGNPANSTSLTSSLPGTVTGRTYNTFGGLKDIVSMVDELVGPSSPRPAASSGHPQGVTSRLGLDFTASGPLGGSSRGPGVSASDKKLTKSVLRSASHMGSPSLSPRSPHRIGASVPAVPAAPSTSRASRRVQLQTLLSKELAQPYDVVKFKKDVKNQAQPVNIAALTGPLQEKFDRVNRKLNNWELVDGAAIERFNAVMDSALGELFSRVNLAWSSGDLDAKAPGVCARPGAIGHRLTHEDAKRPKGPEPRKRPTCSDSDDKSGYSTSPSAASGHGAWDRRTASGTESDDDGPRGSSNGDVLGRSKGRSRNEEPTPGQRNNSFLKAASPGAYGQTQAMGGVSFNTAATGRVPYPAQPKFQSAACAPHNTMYGQYIGRRVSTSAEGIHFGGHPGALSGSGSMFISAAPPQSSAPSMTYAGTYHTSAMPPQTQPVQVPSFPVPSPLPTPYSFGTPAAPGGAGASSLNPAASRHINSYGPTGAGAPHPQVNTWRPGVYEETGSSQRNAAPRGYWEQSDAIGSQMPSHAYTMPAANDHMVDANLQYQRPFTAPTYQPGQQASANHFESDTMTSTSATGGLPPAAWHPGSLFVPFQGTFTGATNTLAMPPFGQEVSYGRTPMPGAAVQAYQQLYSSLTGSGTRTDPPNGLHRSANQ